MNFTAPAARSLKLAFADHARAVHALVLRDIKTRVGSSYLGFLVGLLTPLAHIGILLAIYILLGRRAPIGTDVTMYLASAIVPFVIWSYTHQKVMRALPENRPLLHFPIIRLTDIAIGRAIVELLNAALIVVVVLIALSLFNVDTFVADPQMALFALFMAYLLGVGTGLIFGCLVLAIPGFLIVGVLFIPVYWVTSGALFIPDGLPEQLRIPLAVFPLTHIVDFMRTAVYSQYSSDFPNIGYPCAVIVANLIVFMAVAHFGKVMLTTK